MRKAKLMVTAVVMAIMVAVVPIGVSAASGLNSNESKLLDEARAALGNITMSEVQSAHAESYLAQAESYFSGDGVDISDEQYNTCSAAIAEAEAALPKDVSSISVKELYSSSSVLSAIADKVSASLGIAVTISANGTISIVKGDTPVGSTGESVKQTGFDIEYLALLFSVFAAAMVACAAVAKRKGLFAKNAG